MLQRIKKGCLKCRGRHHQPAWSYSHSIVAPSNADAEMQPIITEGLDTLVNGWATASPEARRIFRQMHAVEAETAVLRDSSAETERNARAIAALFQHE